MFLKEIGRPLRKRLPLGPLSTTTRPFLHFNAPNYHRHWYASPTYLRTVRPCHRACCVLRVACHDRPLQVSFHHSPSCPEVETWGDDHHIRHGEVILTVPVCKRLKSFRLCGGVPPYNDRHDDHLACNYQHRRAIRRTQPAQAFLGDLFRPDP